MAQMRLDKLLTHLNCGSRKEVQALIRAGRVSVEGQVVRDPAAKLDPETAAVSVDGQVQRYRAQRYYMLNKPAGVITASRDTRHPTVLGLFPENERRGLFAVGRLDKDTEGLLIVTDDGALSHALMSPARHVSKVYEAEIEGEMAKDAVQRFAEGRYGLPPCQAGTRSGGVRTMCADHAAGGEIPSGQADGRGSRRGGGAPAQGQAGGAVARSKARAGGIPAAAGGGGCPVAAGAGR